MNRDHYYLHQLSSERLRRCYEIAPPRVKRYLEAEVLHVLNKIHPSDVVLELGCGYGRVLQTLVWKVTRLVGIDTSRSSLMLARQEVGTLSHCHLLQMDGLALAFRNQSFDDVICIQNGISAFQVDPRDLLRESIRVTKKGGKVLFSTYSSNFWADRMEWFRLQADEGLIGEIDWDATEDGTIVCQDGFRATTYGSAELLALASQFEVKAEIKEVNGSSLFLEMTVGKS